MGTIIHKPVKNHRYYYYVESARINGKPTYVNQVYLGTAEKVREMALAYKKPLQKDALYSITKEFGVECLIYDIATRRGIVQQFDKLVPKRNQGATAGMYCLIEAINRISVPTSTSGLQEWYANTFLPVLTGVRPTLLTPQNFWNNTQISEEQLEKIGDALLCSMLEAYKIDTSHLIYDATNFFTYIDTLQKSELAKRGHDKAKRDDLRTVGLALMIAPDYSIPILHDVYPGNRPDSVEFTGMMRKLKERYELISGKKTDVTITFDRGNNSQANIDMLESGDIKLYYVGGLKKNQLPELFAVPKSDYTPLTAGNLAGCSSYRMETTIFKRKLTAVIVNNPELEKGQLQGIEINKGRTQDKLLHIQQSLMKRAKGGTQKGKRPAVASVTNAVEKILGTEFMKDIFEYKVIPEGDNVYLTFGFNEKGLEEITEHHLGKTALFTNHSDFTDDEIVNAYRSAWHVEAAFKQMKDTDHLRVRPIFHWQDSQIRLHIFICVMAYQLCCLLVKELHGHGITTNINTMLEAMREMKVVETFFGNIDKPEKVVTFTVTGELADKIEQLYHLKEKYGAKEKNV